jgi:hypothetical protein
MEGLFEANLGEIRKVLRHLTGVDWSNARIGEALHEAGMVDKDGILVCSFVNILVFN